MAGSNKSSGNPPNHRPTDRPRVVYSEFGPSANTSANPNALERAMPDLPPNQQNLRVQASRAGRKGKTVTIITGFQASTETLSTLLKQLKAQCGTGGALKENTLEIQGDHRPKILQILVELGYKAKISGG